MRTFTKPTSHTQQAHTKTINALDEILKLTGMTFDEWVSDMFEAGWQFANEYFFYSEEVRKSKLQDKEKGYWAWWVLLYLKDDKALLEMYDEMSACEYKKEKEHFVKHLIEGRI